MCALLRCAEEKRKQSWGIQRTSSDSSWQTTPQRHHHMARLCSPCRQLLKEVNASSEFHILLDCAADSVLQVLRQAREVRMMSDYHSYFITSLVSATS